MQIFEINIKDSFSLAKQKICLLLLLKKQSIYLQNLICFKNKNDIIEKNIQSIFLSPSLSFHFELEIYLRDPSSVCL
ncbi:hypothetical protein ABPG72_021367 [Tetrahymena utriculariae]